MPPTAPADEPSEGIPLAYPDARDELLHAPEERGLPPLEGRGVVRLEGGGQASVPGLRQHRQDVVDHV